MFSKHTVRHLEDPKKSLGGAEAIHAIGRKGFERDYPKAAAFIPRGASGTPVRRSSFLSLRVRRWSPDYQVGASRIICSAAPASSGWPK